MSRFLRLFLPSTALLVAGQLAWSQTPAQNDSAAKAAVTAKSLPLITTRTLSFTTSEGTWISLDLTPDGNTMVFELLGDLYTLPLTGGTARRITGGQAYDMQPRYSPDGKQIVFVSDRDGSENLWIADSNGVNPRAITTTERDNYVSPEWTPDGNYIVATKGNQLWLYHRNGGSGVQMSGVRRPNSTLPTPPPPHIGAAFGPDSRYLWVNVGGNPGSGFATRLEPVDYDPEVEPGHSLRSSARQIGFYQIGQLDRLTGRVLLRTHEHQGAFRPIPSPDGKWLVYATRHDAREALKLLDLTSGEDRWLVMDVQRDDHQGGGVRDRDLYPGSAFTPDSKFLITSYGGKLRRIAIPAGTVTDIPFTAQVEQQLGPLAKFEYPINDSVLTVSQIRGARPSPDGKRLVFAALDRLWIADLPAGRGGPGSAAATSPTISGARRLTRSANVEHAPVWSPDRRYIAFVTWNDSTGGDIWRITADGKGQPERLTRTAAFYDKLSYSRDGSRLVAVRGSRMHRMRTLEDFGSHSGWAELEYVWLPAAGGEASRITWTGTGATMQGRNAPHAGPDPERVYVWTGSEGLLSMRFDGTDLQTVVRVTSPPNPFAPPGTPPPNPDEVVISPDGSRALVRSGNNVHMITVPPVGGEEAPSVAVTANSTVPTWRLTRVGGDFMGWQQDGSQAYYSIGRSLFRYDIALADSLLADSVTKARQQAKPGAPKADSAAAAPAAPKPDSAGAAPGAPKPDSAARKPTRAYEPARVDVEIKVPKDKPRGTIVLRGARIVTMKGDEIIESGDVVVRDNRIVGVGARGAVPVPADARIIDVAGKTILPGYVDIHAHTWVAWGLHRSQVSQFLAQLAYGVTTQRDPQTSTEDILSYTDLMEVGELIGPRLYSTGPGVFSRDNIRSLEDARDVLKRYSDHFNTQTIKQYLAGDRKVRQWVIMAARELGLTTTTEGGSNFTMNLTLMQDGYPGLEHSLPISPFFQDVVELERFSGLTYTPTLIVSYGGPFGLTDYLTKPANVDDEKRLRTFTPHDELDKWRATMFFRKDQYVYPLHARQLTRLVEAGGRVGLGSHGEVQGLGVHWELWMIASGGMKPHDALRLATLHSADAIGLARDIGSIEPGKMADLQVLDQNPLEKLEHSTSIRYVMKNGRLYEAETLSEVWPRQRALGSQWWWRLEPGREN